MRLHGFGRFLTTLVSGIAILGSFLAILIFSLHDLGAARLDADIRMYQGSFYSEGQLLYETGPLKKGDLIGYSEMPTKERDANGGVYQFIGWDIDNNGVPDIIGDRIYFNFVADAVYYKLPIPEDFTLTEDQLENLLNLLTHLDVQLTPEQLQMIIDILMGMDIDWTDIDQDLLMRILDFLGMDLEEFMEMLGLDMEGLLALLNAPVLSYTASDYSMPVFFRTQSYGNYNNSKWVKGDYYAASNISEGSVNPLCYAEDKLANVMAPVTYDITYLKNGKFYPVPAYELNNRQGLNSESHSVENPEPAPTEDYPKATHYTTSGYGFWPASAYTILMTNKDGPYSNAAIEADELKYRDYAYSHYLDVDSKYKTYFTNLAKEQGFEKDQFYNFTSKINEYFKEYKLYELNVDEMKSYPSGVDKVMYFMDEAKAGLSEHFATATTLLYRSLGVPARYVEGYFDYPDGTEPRVIGGLYAHSWVEIYVDHIGWMMVDTSVSNVIPEELSNFLFGAPNVAFDTFEKRTLDHIEVESKKTRYFVGSVYDKKDLTITAFYTNGTSNVIDKSIENNTDTSTNSLTIHIPEFNEEATKTIKVIYVENGIPAVAKVQIEVIEPRIVSITAVPSSYRSVYLTGNELDIDNIEFIGQYNDEDDHKEPIPKEDMEIPEISTDVAGEFVYKAVYKLKDTLTADIPITVLSEPVTDLRSISSMSESYNVFINQPLQASALNIKATYADGTYRKISTTTGTLTVTGGDYTKVGTTTAYVSYTERGTTLQLPVTVVVKRIPERVAFYINLTQDYNGQSFDFDNVIEIADLDDRSLSLLGEGDQIEIEFTNQRLMDPEDFIDAGTTFFGIKFRFVNANGYAITDEYLENVTELKIFLDDGVHTPTEDAYPLQRDGDYVNLGVLMFTINQIDLSVTTKDVYIDEYNTRYLSTGTDSYTPIYDNSNAITVTGSLISGDVIDYTNIYFNKDYSNATGQGVENTFTLSSFTIYNSARGKDVTKNYNISYNWGKLYRRTTT